MSHKKIKALGKVPKEKRKSGIHPRHLKNFLNILFKIYYSLRIPIIKTPTQNTIEFYSA